MKKGKSTGRDQKKSKSLWSVRMRAGRAGGHISGAEGIFEEKDVAKILREYSGRAFAHSRGKPDALVLKAETLSADPLYITALPVSTMGTKTAGAEEVMKKAVGLLLSAGVSRKAAGCALRMLKAGGLKGAALLDAKEGRRLDPEAKKGVRASMLGITKKAEKQLIAGLKKAGINGRQSRVRDALIIASKVASASGVVAELCVSDDPDYTTGYVAGAELGYIRLPGIKEKGDRGGGRVFFVKEGFTNGRQIAGLCQYLGKTPVMVGKISAVKDIITPDGSERTNSRSRTKSKSKSKSPDRAKALGHSKPGGKKVVLKKD